MLLFLLVGIVSMVSGLARVDAGRRRRGSTMPVPFPVVRRVSRAIAYGLWVLGSSAEQKSQGYGSSTGSWATKEWTYEDFARDVEAVADAIGVERFYVSGHSSGGPCALACAAHIPERIIGAGVMAGDCEYAEDGAPQLGQFPEGCAFVFGRYIMCGPVRKSNFRRPRHRRDVVSVNAPARWRGGSLPSSLLTQVLVDFHTANRWA